jgi:RNA polymerase-binding transcription factor DksA
MTDVEPDQEPASEAPLPDGADAARIEAELDDVAVALERLEQGGYGTCEACGAELPDEVLVLTPAARRCAEHAA